ncbi:MAG: CDP-glucose 4,6-dehydratase [Proteobacteria bacterium]|nr:CDP-glucose 4,6-dehydratase [Pseudomonadota bacterium]
MRDLLSKKYKGQRVLLTGHTGFKGSWLGLWLAELGAEVVGVALPPETKPSHFELCALEKRIRHEVVDIRSADGLLKLFKETRPEIVFHLAAQAIVRQSYDTPKETFDINVLGTVNLLECIRVTDSAKAAVIITSDKCYENKEWEFSYRENDPMGGHDPYSASKGAAELAVASYRRSFFNAPGRRLVGCATSRAGNVIGGGDWGLDRLIPDCVRALSNRRAIEVRNPTSFRPWQHVLDALAGYLLLGARLLDAPQKYSDAYNFGPTAGEELSVKDLVSIFLERWGSGSWDSNSPDGEPPHEARLLRLSSERARQRLGWKPRLETRTAVAWTADWYRMALEKGFSPGAMESTSVEQINKYMNVS